MQGHTHVLAACLVVSRSDDCNEVSPFIFFCCRIELEIKQLKTEEPSPPPPHNLVCKAINRQPEFDTNDWVAKLQLRFKRNALFSRSCILSRRRRNSPNAWIARRFA